MAQPDHHNLNPTEYIAIIGATELDRRRRELVAALMSEGAWKQATGVLCRLDETGAAVGYCCLGVASEVAIVDGLRLETRDLADTVGLDQGEADLVDEHGPSRRYGALDSRDVATVTELHPDVAAYYGFTATQWFWSRDPMLDIPPKLFTKYEDKIRGCVDGSIYTARKAPATCLNDTICMSLRDIGECFQYTYLREDWDHAQSAG